MIIFLTLILFAAGIFFFFAGTVGLIRLPDVYTRIHAPTKCDTLGAGSILLGLMLYEGISFTTFKLFFVLVFFLMANPTGAHVLARGSYKHLIRPCKETVFDEYREVF